MRAWAWGLRRNPALAQRGSFMSSTYFPRPVRNRKSSGRGSGFPTYILRSEQAQLGALTVRTTLFTSSSAQVARAILSMHFKRFQPRFAPPAVMRPFFAILVWLVLVSLLLVGAIDLAERLAIPWSRNHLVQVQG